MCSFEFRLPTTISLVSTGRPTRLHVPGTWAPSDNTGIQVRDHTDNLLPSRLQVQEL